MFKKLIKYLYKKYVSPDVAGMTREQLGVFNKPYNSENDSQDEQNLFYVETKLLYENAHLKRVIEEVIEEIKEGMIYNSDPACIVYDRFSINGISLIWDRLEHYAGQAPNLDVEFDKYSIT